MDQDYVLPSATVLFLRRPLHTHTLPYFSFPVYGARPCVIRHPRQPRDTRSVSFTGKSRALFRPRHCCSCLSLESPSRWTDFPTGDQKSNGRSVWCVIQPPSGVTITTTVVRTLKWSTQCLIVAASVVSSNLSRTDLDLSPYLLLLALCSDYYRNL